MGTGLSRG